MEFPEETSAAPKPITVKQLVYRLRDTAVSYTHLTLPTNREV